MGAWGPRSFENDSALDWIGELDGIRPLRAALQRALKAKPDVSLDVDDASVVIAAGEVVAAARGYALAKAPAQLKQWIADHGDEVTAADATLAAKAIARVQKGSELQALWAEGGKANQWTSEVARLVKRIAATPKPTRAKRASVSKPKARTGRPADGHEALQMRLAASPNGKVRAAVTSRKGVSLVTLEAEWGAGSPCAVRCDFDKITICWIGNAKLEVRYPAEAKVVDRQDSWSSSGHTVAIRYVTT